LSHLYGLGMLARERLYAAGLIAQRALPVKVISIGNLSAGGTGKTPVVIALANALRGNGRRVGVVSRGYGRRATSDILEVSDGRSIQGDPENTGDEPLLIAERCPGVPVVVGADRYAAGRYLLDRFKVDTLVLDDGFQHLALKRDIDIVLLDATAPFGNSDLLPRGRLRERLSALKRASLIFVTRAGQAEDLADVLKAIRHVAPSMPLCVTDFIPTSLQKIGAASESKPPDALKGERVVALSGIGNPDSFRRLLESLGATVIDHCIYPDHHRYSIQDIRRVEKVAGSLRADHVVTTEKDAVKLQLLRDSVPLSGMWVLRIDVNWLEGWKEWERLVLQN
jgi:tetraacyldisaccharide 4'-kinase